MSPNTLFYIILAIIIIDFIIDEFLDALNAKHFDDPIPEELNDVYNQEEYEKSQRYKKTKYKFGLISSLFSLVVLLTFFFLDGFEFVDDLARSFSDNSIIVGLIFFGIIIFTSDLLSL
ncbi:MAG TPA: M48 family peptidase, partial [Salinimicrobium sp.]|nr:M48 family peptidase [Salinimicrobium sp.]